MNPYEMLGVAIDATNDEITTAYRSKAKLSHPDAGGSSEEFNEYTKAYKLLIDSKSRAKYDTTGEANEDEINNDYTLVVNMIMNNIYSAIATAESRSINPASIDILAGVATGIKNHIASLENSVGAYHNQRNNLRRCAARMLKKSQGRNIISTALESRAKDILKSIDALKQDVALNRQALELLSDYAFDVETGGFPTYSLRLR